MIATARSVRRGSGRTESTASHSVRTPKETWAGATARARREGLTINRVLIELLEGYRRGVYRLPKRQTEVVRTYDNPTAAPPTGSVPDSSSQ
jgi:hypothetical protein